MQPDLRGRTALVTGSGRGIGRSTAVMLANAGARVVVTARSRDEIERVASEIRDGGGDAVAIPADLASTDSIQRLFDEAGPVDILVNNAGVIAPITPAWRSPPDEWLRNIAVNLNAVYLACRLALPGMLDRGWGRIINVSSGAARGTTPGWSAYSAAKAGVEAFTSVVAQEITDTNAARDSMPANMPRDAMPANTPPDSTPANVARGSIPANAARGSIPANVRINGLRPGIVDTEMQVEIRGTSQDEFSNVERFRSYKASNQLRHPDDPARAILWLLSADSDIANGQTIAIDDPEIAAKIGLTPMTRR